MKNTVLLTILCFLSVLLFNNCSKSDNGYSNNSNSINNNTNTSTNTVSIPGMSFSPGTITIKAGITVTWKNNDYTAHTVTADDSSFDSGNLDPGQSFSHTFSSAGTINYHCKYHTMTGKVIVS
jgi:plastocyanin